MKQARRGHPDVFTIDQNAALRTGMGELKARRHYSQTALGNMLGVSQQSAGQLLRGDSGFSYASATRLVRALGYAGVDTFFRSKDVALPSLPSTGTDG